MIKKKNLLAPNGKPSNLTPKQYKLVRSPEFISWFGNWIDSPETASKVVDENGEPLIVYHGTNNKFWEFDKNKQITGYYGKGFYFCNVLERVSTYGKRVIPVFLNIKSIFPLSDNTPQELLNELAETDIDVVEFGEENDIEQRAKYTFGYASNNSDIFVENLKKKGYYGIKLDYLVEENVYYFIAFEPTQIKLASGKNTTFDSNNPDIRYSRGGSLSKTPAPKSERIYGSKTNAPKSSSTSISASKISFSEETLNSIKNKISEHNEKYPKKKISLAVAKAVVRRGMGAYSSTHRPTIKGGKPNSRVAWGLARLNAFIYKIQKGHSKSGKYRQDNDLINELGYRVSKFNDGGELKFDEEAQQLIDIISMNPNLEQYQKYKLILKDKFGIDFDFIYKDQEYIENANLNDIKKQNDFLDFDNWLKYAKIISKKRGFIPMNLYDTPNNQYELTDEIWNETAKKLNFNVKKIPYIERGTGSGDIARAFGDTIYYTDQSDIYYFLHELGHVYDFQNRLEGIIKNPAYSPTNYGTTHSGETFAENFAIYFINPIALKNWNEDVYNAMDLIINDKYKKEIYKILSKNHYSNDGSLDSFTHTTYFVTGETDDYSNEIY